jgi:hypothetical protein
MFCTLVQAVALNLVCQLGGLCAAHTRKATILQGEVQGRCWECCHSTPAQEAQHAGTNPGALLGMLSQHSRSGGAACRHQP